jgi:hypothetical protein
VEPDDSYIRGGITKVYQSCRVCRGVQNSEAFPEHLMVTSKARTKTRLPKAPKKAKSAEIQLDDSPLEAQPVTQPSDTQSNAQPFEEITTKAFSSKDVERWRAILGPERESLLKHNSTMIQLLASGYAESSFPACNACDDKKHRKWTHLAYTVEDRRGSSSLLQAAFLRSDVMPLTSLHNVKDGAFLDCMDTYLRQQPESEYVCNVEGRNGFLQRTWMHGAQRLEETAIASPRAR